MDEQFRKKKKKILPRLPSLQKVRAPVGEDFRRFSSVIVGLFVGKVMRFFELNVLSVDRFVADSVLGTSYPKISKRGANHAKQKRND